MSVESGLSPSKKLALHHPGALNGHTHGHQGPHGASPASLQGLVQWLLRASSRLGSAIFCSLLARSRRASSIAICRSSSAVCPSACRSVGYPDYSLHVRGHMKRCVGHASVGLLPLMPPGVNFSKLMDFSTTFFPLLSIAGKERKFVVIWREPRKESFQ